MNTLRIKVLDYEILNAVKKKQKNNRHTDLIMDTANNFIL